MSWSSPLLSPQLDVPERSPSPRVIQVDLVDVEHTESGPIPKFTPSPTRIWVDLQDAEGLPGGAIPEFDPNPSFLLIHLHDIDEDDPISQSLAQVALNDGQDVSQSEILVPLEEPSSGLTFYEIDGSMLSGTGFPLAAAVPSSPSGDPTTKSFQAHIDVVAANMTTLEELRSSNLSLTRESAQALANVLPTLRALKNMTLVNIFAGVPDVADQEAILGVICDALNRRNTPLSLTASSIRVYPSILPFIRSNNCLKSLALDSVDLTGNIFSKLCFDLVEWTEQFLAESKEPPLHSLSITRCKIGNNEWGSLGRVFETNAQLRNIDLSGNAMGAETIMAILPAIMHCPQLSELNISGNASTSGRLRHTHNENALATLGEALPSWPLLRVLRLTGFPLSNEKGDKLFDALQGLMSPILEVLAVSGVDYQAADRLKVVVKDHLLHLTDLDLRPSTEVTDEDVHDLENILKARGLDARLSV